MIELKAIIKYIKKILYFIGVLLNKETQKGKTRKKV